MTLVYSLNESDYLQHQLFLASKSKRINNQRLRSWLIMTAAMLVLALILYEKKDTFLAVTFIALGILTLLFYPLYLRSHYKDHYSKFIAEQFKCRFGETITLKFTPGYIESNDSAGEAKIYLREIESVIETGEHFYLRLRPGGDIIVPKRSIDEPNFFIDRFKKLAANFEISVISDLSWKWK